MRKIDYIIIVVDIIAAIVNGIFLSLNIFCTVKNLIIPIFV